MTQLTIGEIREKLCFVNASLIAVSRSRTSDLATRSVPELIRVTGLEVETRLEQECFVSEYLAPIKRCEIQRRNITREKEFLLRSKWRESVGIEPTSLLAKTSAVLKTERATRPVLSHGLCDRRRFEKVCPKSYVASLKFTPSLSCHEAARSLETTVSRQQSRRGRAWVVADCHASARPRCKIRRKDARRRKRRPVGRLCKSGSR